MIENPIKPQIKVAKVIDAYKLVINRGSEQGIEVGQRYLIYSIGEEILDPDTKQNLGNLEIVKGTGKVTHSQDKISTISSDMKSLPGRTIRRAGGSAYSALKALALMGAPEIEEELPPEPMPFNSPEVGDLAKRI